MTLTPAAPDTTQQVDTTQHIANQHVDTQHIATRHVDTTQHVRIAIRSTPEEVWRALIDGAVSPAYYLGFRADIDPTPGSDYRYTAGGGDMITGTVLAAERGRHLSMTFTGLWDAAVAALPESVVTFDLLDPSMPMAGVTVLSCRHEGLPDTELASGLELGWVTILSGLKTLLETGRPMAGAVD